VNKVAQYDGVQTFFFWTLNCSMMTPMKRLSVKNEPNTMNSTKYRYMYALFSFNGCSFNCDTQRSHDNQFVRKT